MSQTFQVQIIRKAEIKFHTDDLVYLSFLKLSFLHYFLQLRKWLFSYIISKEQRRKSDFPALLKCDKYCTWLNQQFGIYWTEWQADRHFCRIRCLNFRIYWVIPRYFKGWFEKLSFYAMKGRLKLFCWGCARYTGFGLWWNVCQTSHPIIM